MSSPERAVMDETLTRFEQVLERELARIDEKATSSSFARAYLLGRRDALMQLLGGIRGFRDDGKVVPFRRPW